MSNLLQTLQEQGHDPKRIESIVGGVRAALAKKGMSNYEIDQKLGIAPFDTSDFQEFLVNAARDKFGEDGGGFARGVFSLDDFFSAGFEQSTLSMVFDRPSQESDDALMLEDKSLAQDTAASLGTLVGDLPAMVGGFIIGGGAGAGTGPGALITGTAGAFALPEVLRTVMMDAYENGTITSFAQFWDLLVETSIHGAKGYITGAATGTAGWAVKPLASVLPGSVLPATAKLSAEVAAFTTVGAGLEGRVPEPREFLLGATTILGLRAGTKSAGFIAKKSRDIYRKVGKRPIDMQQDILIEPTIREDLASENIETPRAYMDPDQIGRVIPLTKLVRGEDGKPLTFETMEAATEFVENRQEYMTLYSQGSSRREPIGDRFDIIETEGIIRVTRDATKDELDAAGGKPPGLPAPPAPKQLPSPVERTRREFLQGSAAAAAVLSTGGKVPLSQVVMGSATSNKSTLVFEGGRGGVAVLFPEKAGLDMFGSDGIGVQLKGVKDFAEAKEITERLPGSEEPSHLVVYRAEAKEIEFIDISEKSEIEIDLIVEKAEAEGVLLDTDFFGAHTSLKDMFEFEKNFTGGDMQLAGERVESITNGKFRLNPITNEMEATETGKKIFKQLADRLERVAKEREVEAVRQLPGPESHGAGGKPPPPPPPKQLPSPESPSDRIGKRISVGETEAKQPRSLHDLYESIFDDLHPLARTVKTIKEAGSISELAAHEDPLILARNLRGVSGVGDSFLEFGALEYAGKSKVGESFREIVRPIDQAGRLQPFREYMIAVRVLELEKRGIETGIDPKDAKATVEAGKKEFADHFKRLRIFQTTVLAYLKDSGVISEKSFKHIEEANKDFVPLNRVMDPNSTAGEGLRTWTPIKRITGSKRTIVDPIESIMRNVYVLTTLAERNRTMNALVDLHERAPHLKLIRKKKATSTVTKVESKELQKLLEPYLGSGKKVKDQLSEADISVFRSKVFLNDKDVIRFKDGKAEVYEVNPDLARALAAMDRGELDAVVKILALPASLLRTGAILTDTFMALNFMRDTVSAFLYSKDGFIPVIDTFVGMAHILGRSKAYQEWVAFGGQFAHLQAIDRSYHQKGLKEILTSLPARNVVRNPLEILRAMSGLVEQGTRVKVFERRARKAQKKEGKPRIEALTEAAFEARDVTLDFQKFGAKTRSLNAMSAFLNPFLQGQDKLVRAFKDRPVAMTARVFAGIVLPSVMLHLAQRDEKWYKELAQWERDLHWNFKVDDVIWKIPKPFEIGLIFGTGAENFVEWMIDGDDKTARRFLNTLAKSVVPNLIPQALMVSREVWANKSVFLDRPIIPRDREGLLSELQHGLYTSETAKLIGRAIGAVPLVGPTDKIASGAVVEHIIRGWTGGLGKYALDLIDGALVASGAVPDNIEPTPSVLSRIPFIKAFVVRHPSLNTSTIERFYEAYARQESIMKSYKKLVAEGRGQEAQELFIDTAQSGGIYRLAKQREAMANMSKMIRRMYRLKKMEGMDDKQLAQWKRENIDALYIRMNQIAATGLAVADAFEESIAK